ncbi:VWA domain-containing protein [Pyxidicoccus fallax]|uniref:VWA domain-containing protein n=1 Tax=Pyxidicoccus fallax TaxID=394095 RepID=A0A848LQN9_9BACT|nr:VWA domain-containing protein [Pyxidicoccus fallax]NMO20207.1 VWA domain-containing protein [Pyxidicoccus fallax]NPC82718.1 VWA domain-containing protein [Pyxidicoccus fallax]
MNRTLLLVTAAGLLALAALVLGKPPSATPTPPSVTDTSHTVAKADEAPATVTLPLVTSTPADGALTLSGKLSGAYVQRGRSEAFAWLELKARPTEKGHRVPVNLALVLDRSGSMAGKKLEDAKRAAAELVRRLTPEDRLAFVDYGSDVRVLPSRNVTEEVRSELLMEIARLSDQGSTHLSGGLTGAAGALRPYLKEYRVSRAILLSDGQPTMGIVSEPALFNLARSLRDEGITVSALGVGADFQESLMRGIAEQGGGFSGFIDDSARLAEVFSRELDQATSTVARNVELELLVSDAVQAVEVMGVPSTRQGNVVKVPLYDLAGDQSVRVVTKLTLATPASGTEVLQVLGARARYVDVARGGPAETALSLTARATDDAALVRANLDKDVRVHATRALGTQQLVAAAEEMKRGNRAAASGLLDNARRIFGASAQALSSELADVDQTQAAYRSAAGEDDVRRETRQLYKKTMQNFGQNNAY